MGLWHDVANNRWIDEDSGQVVAAPSGQQMADSQAPGSVPSGYGFIPNTDPNTDPNWLRQTYGNDIIRGNDGLYYAPLNVLHQLAGSDTWLDKFASKVPQLAGIATGLYGAGLLGGAASGASGLGSLASETGFVPGSFSLGASGYGGTAAAGLDAAAAEWLAGGAAGAGGAPSLFDWSGGLAEDAGMSANDWYAQQVANGGGDLSSLMAPNAAGGTSFLDALRRIPGLSNLLPGGSGGSGSSGGFNLGDLGKGALQAGLGYLGNREQQQAAERQQQALLQAQKDWLAMGQPSRDRLEASYQPGFDIFNADPGARGAAENSADIAARSYSSKVGNPFDQPGAQGGIYRTVLNQVGLPQLNTYRSQNATSGQFGVNTAGTASLGAAGQAGATGDQSGLWNALGYGLNTAIGGGRDDETSQSLSKLLNQYKITI